MMRKFLGGDHILERRVKQWRRSVMSDVKSAAKTRWKKEGEKVFGEMVKEVIDAGREMKQERWGE